MPTAPRFRRSFRFSTLPIAATYVGITLLYLRKPLVPTPMEDKFRILVIISIILAAPLSFIMNWTGKWMSHGFHRIIDTVLSRTTASSFKTVFFLIKSVLFLVLKYTTGGRYQKPPYLFDAVSATLDGVWTRIGSLPSHSVVVTVRRAYKHQNRVVKDRAIEAERRCEKSFTEFAENERQEGSIEAVSTSDVERLLKKNITTEGQRWPEVLGERHGKLRILTHVWIILTVFVSAVSINVWTGAGALTGLAGRPLAHVCCDGTIAEATVLIGSPLSFHWVFGLLLGKEKDEVAKALFDRWETRT